MITPIQNSPQTALSPNQHDILGQMDRHRFDCPPKDGDTVFLLRLVAPS